MGLRTRRQAILICVAMCLTIALACPGPPRAPEIRAPGILVGRVPASARVLAAATSGVVVALNPAVAMVPVEESGPTLADRVAGHPVVAVSDPLDAQDLADCAAQLGNDRAFDFSVATGSGPETRLALVLRAGEDLCTVVFSESSRDVRIEHAPAESAVLMVSESSASLLRRLATRPRHPK